MHLVPAANFKRAHRAYHRATLAEEGGAIEEQLNGRRITRPVPQIIAPSARASSRLTDRPEVQTHEQATIVGRLDIRQRQAKAVIFTTVRRMNSQLAGRELVPERALRTIRNLHHTIGTRVPRGRWCRACSLQLQITVQAGQREQLRIQAHHVRCLGRRGWTDRDRRQGRVLHRQIVKFQGRYRPLPLDLHKRNRRRAQAGNGQRGQLNNLTRRSQPARHRPSLKVKHKLKVLPQPGLERHRYTHRFTGLQRQRFRRDPGRNHRRTAHRAERKTMPTGLLRGCTGHPEIQVQINMGSIPGRERRVNRLLNLVPLWPGRNTGTHPATCVQVLERALGGGGYRNLPLVQPRGNQHAVTAAGRRGLKLKVAIHLVQRPQHARRRSLAGGRQLGPQCRQLLLMRSPECLGLRGRYQRQHRPHFLLLFRTWERIPATVKNAIKGVVVLRGHRIKLVIMAAGTAQAQAQHALAQRVNSVLDRQMMIILRIEPEPA